MIGSKLDDLSREELLAATRRLLAEADSLATRISAVNEIGVAANSTLSLEEIEQVVARQAKWLLDFAHCSILLRKNPEEKWALSVLFGPAIDGTFQWEAMPNTAPVILRQQPQLIRMGSAAPFLKEYPSQLIVPLVADNIIYGSIQFAGKEENLYTLDDMRIAYMLALQLSSAIRNASIVDELTRTKEELQMRVEELDAYGHTIAHDLKEPLSSVMMYCELIAMKHKGELPDPVMDMLRRMHTGTERMTSMSDQLLWLAQLRDSNEVLEPIDARRIAKRALKRFEHELEKQQIQVSISEMPWVKAHARWLEEIFANLVGNAIKYGCNNPNSTIDIKAVEQDDMVRFEITDNGPGLTATQQHQLFKLNSMTNKLSKQGTGLGLSIVKRMVKHLNGTLGLESEPGQGATFWFAVHRADIPKAPSDKV